jgi:hypothetical protein
MDEACLPVPSTKKHASRRIFSRSGGGVRTSLPALRPQTGFDGS